jgi:phosphomannomutase
VKDVIVSVSGVRGVIGRGLDPLVFAEMAAHFGDFLGPGPVVVGRDSRVSGEMAMAAVTAGLLGVGRRIIDLGIVATPTVEVAIRDLNAAGGIQISASHNPVEWNALKLLSARGIFLTPDEGAEYRRRLASGRPAFRAWDALGSVLRRRDFPDIHVERILASPLVDVAAIRAKRLVVVVDCVHGAGGEVADRLLSRLDARFTLLFAEPTGRFPHDPEPRPENLAALAQEVRRQGADIGFALDPDADRVAVVDETGRPIGEEVTLAAVVDSVLPRVGGDVVVNVSTTMAIDEVAARHGRRVHRTPVGEVHVTERMLVIGAKIGGEGNGGIIVPDVNPGRDGLLGIALWVDALVREKLPASALAARIPSTVMRKEKFELSTTDADRVLQELESGWPEAQVDRTDGLKLLVEGGWVHVRRSNTEPILRLLAEARDEASADELVRRARAIVEGAAARS